MVLHPESNVLVTSEMDAAAGALSVVADGVNGADLYGINAESIAALHYAILETAFEADSIDLSVLRNHKLVYTYNEMHGGWLFRFPDDIVSALAMLYDDSLVRTAGAWSNIFEHDGSPPTFVQVEEMFRQIVTLAQYAIRTGKPMYWLAPDC